MLCFVILVVNDIVGEKCVMKEVAHMSSSCKRSNEVHSVKVFWFFGFFFFIQMWLTVGNSVEEYTAYAIVWSFDKENVCNSPWTCDFNWHRTRLNELRASWNDTEHPVSPPVSLSLFLLPSPSLALLQHLRDQPDCGGGRTTHQREWEGTSDREVRLPTGILRLLLWGRFPDACRTRWGEGVLGLDERRPPRLLLAPSASSEESTGDNTFSADIRQASLSWSKCTLHQCAKYTRINPWDTRKPQE